MRSGLSKTELAGIKTKFVIGQPLSNGGGGHIATIKAVDLTGLPLLEKAGTARSPDFIAVPRKADIAAMRFLIFVHPTEEQARLNKWMVGFRRLTLKRPLYLGIDAVTESEPYNGTSAVFALGGWGPNIRPSDVTDLVYTLTTQPVQDS